MTNSRLKKIQVKGLQGSFDYEIEFGPQDETLILIAPNGHGKTAFLSLINACLRYNLTAAAKHRFKSLTIEFADGTKRVFEKAEGTDVARLTRQGARSGRFSNTVKVQSFDKKGKEVKTAPKFDFSGLPLELVARAVERALPDTVRSGIDTFRVMGRDDRISLNQVIEDNFEYLMNEEYFVDYLRRHGANLHNDSDDKLSCVFIETQRLLYSRKPSPSDGDKSMPEEEIVRQVQSLAQNLRSTFGNYAAISQELDRSFPSRLVVAAAASTGQTDVDAVRIELQKIEERRQAFTQAGILVESSENLIAPDDALLSSLGVVFDLYIDDSNTKLKTFDDIFSKISVFRDLVRKKLWRKEIHISREHGVEIRSGKDRLDITQLSSGEKHEFIMLFKLIFETPPNSVVLIDEPEISLHVVWQLEFLDDLRQIQSINPFQSIIATHSPQIVQGADEITIDLSRQVH